MKLFVSLALVAILFSEVLFAKQNNRLSENEKRKIFYFGPGIGIGIFYPENINEYMTDYYSNMYQSFGTFDMVMYFSINATGSLFFTKFTELQIETEFAYSPKFFLINDESEYFSYQRLTPQVKFNFHIPFSRRFSYFIGAGSSYNFLKFESPEDEFTGNTTGFSAQTGVMFKFRKIAIQPGFTMNFIKADADKKATFNNSGNISTLSELSYTGGHIGCKILF
jgi:hypothetical protein